MEKLKTHSRSILIALSALSFLGFVIFTLLVRADFLRSFDFNMTVRIQDDIPLRLDGFFSTLSVIGRFEWMVVYLVILLIFKRKILGGIITFGLFGFAHVLELIGKTILEQPGPPKMFLRAQFGDFPGLHVFTDASYPSGHSLRIVFFSILLIAAILNIQYIKIKSQKIFDAIKIDNKQLKNFLVLVIQNLIPLSLISIFLIFCFVVLISRISLGEHWTTDVIGGGLLGASFAFLSQVFLMKGENKKKK